MSWRHCHCALVRMICSRSGGDSGSVSRKNSLRSMPALNESPAPASTSTLQRGSISSAFITASISAASVGLMALRFSGRFIVTQAMPFSNSTSTVLLPGTGADASCVVTDRPPSACSGVSNWHEQYQSQPPLTMIATRWTGRQRDPGSSGGSGMRAIVRGAAMVVACWCAGIMAAAAAYPERPIRLIVSFPPGGSSDAMARIVQPGLERLFAQPVVIENRAGAGGMIAIDAVAKSAPDGYVLGLGGAGALGTNLALGEKMSYDPRKDIAPVTGLAGSPFILAAAPSFPGGSLRAVIAQAKASAEKLAIGHGGNGTLMHLTAELFNQMAGTRVTLVPYRGIAPVVSDLVGSHVALGIIDPPSGMAAIEGGQIKTIAITSAKRFP